MLLDKKLFIARQKRWEHHRSGWPYVIDNLYNELHNEYGIKLIDNLDDYFNNEISDIIDQPWVGILHMPITLPQHIKQKYPLIYSVSDFIKSYLWRMNKLTCRGLITLSIENQLYLESVVKMVPILHCIHPTKPPDITFNIEKYFENRRLVSIGHWLRDFNVFFETKYAHQKLLLKPFNDIEFESVPPQIKIVDRISNNDYDNLLASSVVFLNLYCASANNTIIECVVRNTPVVVNRLPTVEEYLGNDYPLFYDDINHANDIVNNDRLLIDGYDYLTKRDKRRFTIDNFITTIVNSHLYSSL